MQIKCIRACSLLWIPSGRNNRYIKKIVMETWIYSGSGFNLLNMMARTKVRKAELIPHGLIRMSYGSYHNFLVIFMNSGRNPIRWKRMRPKSACTKFCVNRAEYTQNQFGNRSLRATGPCSPTAIVSFFLFSFFNIFFHKLCAQLVFQKKLRTQLVVYIKSYAYNSSLKKKLYAQVILEIIVHTNCTDKFCMSPNLCL
jgi:hypothetical protein